MYRVCKRLCLFAEFDGKIFYLIFARIYLTQIPPVEFKFQFSVLACQLLCEFTDSLLIRGYAEKLDYFLGKLRVSHSTFLVL